MLRKARHRAMSCAHPALVAGALAGCAGTPLPEPPDGLPKAPDIFSRPDFSRIGPSTSPVTTTTAESTAPLEVMLAGTRGAADPGAELWAIDLDAAGPPFRTAVDATGAFVFPKFTASANDRVRIVSRGARGHSAALDLVVTATAVPGVATLRPLVPTELACLSIVPDSETVVLGDAGDLKLQNDCSAAVSLVSLRLRFGDQGFVLGGVPAPIAAGSSALLSVRDARGPEAVERGDIVLVEVLSADGQPGRYAIAVYSALLP